jgi:hypothetical protein
MKDVEINEFDYNDIDTGRNVNVYFCNKLNKHLIPPKREIIGTWYSPVYDLDTGKEIKEMFMLKECEYEKI